MVTCFSSRPVNLPARLNVVAIGSSLCGQFTCLVGLRAIGRTHVVAVANVFLAFGPYNPLPVRVLLALLRVSDYTNAFDLIDGISGPDAFRSVITGACAPLIALLAGARSEDPVVGRRSSSAGVRRVFSLTIFPTRGIFMGDVSSAALGLRVVNDIVVGSFNEVLLKCSRLTFTFEDGTNIFCENR